KDRFSVDPAPRLALAKTQVGRCAPTGSNRRRARHSLTGLRRGLRGDRRRDLHPPSPREGATMTHRRSTCGAILGGAVALVALVTSAHADPVVCQNQVIKTLASFKKISLTATEKCLDKENQGKLPGPCPDTATQLKIQKKSTSATDKISTSCTMGDLTALGFPGNCQFEAATQGKEGQCAALPVTTPAEFSACLQCWKAAEVSESLAILYASHALEACGGSLDEGSPTCSGLDFATPLPDQRNLGDTAENDCQVGIGKA